MISHSAVSLQRLLRTRWLHESPSAYDTDFYCELAIQAAESVVVPLGRDRGNLPRYLTDMRPPLSQLSGAPIEY